MTIFPPTEQYGKRLCAVCNSSASRLLFRQKFSNLSDNGTLLSGYDVVVCAQCGFCFADNIPDQTIFDAYYRDMSKYEKIGPGREDTIYDKARFQAMANTILQFLPSPKLQIFEIGCANGQLLALLKQNGYLNVSGIDPSSVSAQIAKKRYGINVSAHTISDLPLNNNQRIDFIILAGVVEHVKDLSPALQSMRRLLSDSGFIFITVPDASRYTEGEDAPFQEFSVEHINFFGPTSLENILNANGFTKTAIIQDMIESNYRTSTPVIHGLFKKSDLFITSSYPSDNQTEISLKGYIEQSSQIDRRIQTRINEIIDAGKSIIVWGTGAHTLRLLEAGPLGTAKIRTFVDSNPRYQRKALKGIPIISPDKLIDMPEPILISSRVYQEEIATQIRIELNLDNEIIKLY